MKINSSKKLSIKVIALAVYSVSITGCAPMISGAMNMAVTPNTVQEKTVKYFGAAPSDIQISNIEKNTLATTYQVKYAGKFYNCSIYYGEVTCKQPGA